MLDLSKLFIGGDSAGAQIALQYATVQTNANYAKELGMTAALPASHLKGTLSYCGPVDLKQMANQQSDNRFMKFSLKQWLGPCSALKTGRRVRNCKK